MNKYIDEKDFNPDHRFWYIEVGTEKQWRKDTTTIYRANDLTRVMKLWKLSADERPVIKVGSLG